MSKRIDPKEWADDFASFLETPEMRPPAHLQEKVFDMVHRDLNPTLSAVLAKLGGIHVVAGSISLLLCSQFGIGRGYDLMHVLMNYGEFACMFFCGSLFLGFTVFAAGIVLTPPELKKIRRAGYSPIAALALFSLLLFEVFGAEVAVNVGLAWLFGAVIAGIFATEASIRFKRMALE